MSKQKQIIQKFKGCSTCGGNLNDPEHEHCTTCGHNLNECPYDFCCVCAYPSDENGDKID